MQRHEEEEEITDDEDLWKTQKFAFYSRVMRFNFQVLTGAERRK